MPQVCKENYDMTLEEVSDALCRASFKSMKIKLKELERENQFLLKQNAKFLKQIVKEKETIYKINKKGTLASVERGVIQSTLEETKGNRTKAADIMGVSIRTLRNKIKHYKQQGYDYFLNLK